MKVIVLLFSNESFLKDLLFTYSVLGSPFEAETGFTIKRPEQFGGDKVYPTFEQLSSDFAQKLLHPGDLKTNVERYHQ